MSRRRSTRQQATGPGRPFQRTDRIGETIRELVAGELERIGDERLDLVTITSADVDGDLARARVYYSAMLAGAEGRLDEVIEALDELRWPLQKVINRNIRARKTPQISFERDTSIEAGLRIEEVLAGLKATDEEE
ncbi:MULTISPECIES: 30S ribosome-binding factor RbfA [Candidatus Microthrix]|jgi:ribosome-binding factor A|uniref:Ribosome-binding factor A n=1 Tax=Candidatus Neomicrothrix parvicella RN1 TaxID=1229780 RepID=R4Z5Y1_9ACTN|nr:MULTISPECIES: 30S ribosome-binding factor RbfA [Microthrix]HBX08516.1 30S ribosome-binding factor RbfA [Candidatus Microthrix parvicella]MBK6501365.1 30S ribosome-binding factor RbfA [Candidatus Microthrix sp.]MBK7019973.1 30S ribosome-binding factor RbfA [Candidatus Microthrix sp.]MBL0202808.1 30S ribosome-binding factor RbfA [Candidatus Microthrix sp.]MBP6134848.1 30S ribosome-binding factor RbfA [Candidatus Microthrix sp.]